MKLSLVGNPRSRDRVIGNTIAGAGDGAGGDGGDGGDVGGGGGPALLLPDAITSLSPLHYWKCNEAAGNIVNYGSRSDVLVPVGSGYGYRTAVGPDGENYFSTSIGSRLELTPTNVPMGADGATWAFMYMLLQSKTHVGLLSQWHTDGDKRWLFYSFNGGNLDFIWKDGIRTSIPRSSSLEVSTWYWAVVTSSISDGTVRVYNDYTATPVGTLSDTNTGPITTSDTTIEFSNLSSYGGTYDASIAFGNIAYWDRVLDGTEIQALMDGAVKSNVILGTFTPGTVTPGSGLHQALQDVDPLLYLPLDDASGSFRNLGYFGDSEYAGTGSGYFTYQERNGPDGMPVTYFGNNHIVIPHHKILNRKDGRTIFVCYRTSGSGHAVVFGKMHQTVREYAAWAATSGANDVKFRVYQANSPSITGEITPPGQAAFVWNVAAMRINADGSLDVWHNGTKYSVTPSASVEAFTDAPLAIGALLAYAGYGFVGQMAKFAMFQAPLPDATIDALMTEASTEGWF